MAAGWDDTRLHLEVEDEEYSADHLRRGAVVGAVTALVIVYLLMNLLVDLLYGALDPRISND